MKPLTDTLYSFNTRLSRNSNIWEVTKINSILRLLTRQIANNYLPTHYKKSRHNYHKREDSVTLPVIVSLTSFPARIQKVWITIESIIRQQSTPEKIILWLSRDQFPNEKDNLPQDLIAQQTRGLEIRFVDGDIKSHKKYYYVFREYPDKYILTIDDDLLFPTTFIKETYQYALQNPNSVIAHFGSVFQWNSNIEYLEKIARPVTPGETGPHLFFGSGGGTLFPPKRLAPYLDDISTIFQLCPTADDIYLNALARIAGCDITFRGIYPLLSITNKNDKKLTDHNGYLFSPNSTNAKQFRALIAHTKKRWGCNPFEIN